MRDSYGYAYIISPEGLAEVPVNATKKLAYAFDARLSRAVRIR